MFGKKKKYSSAKIDTLIAKNTTINGDLIFSGGLHIDGKVVGNVIAEEGSLAVLSLSENGSIEGEVKVPNMVLNGKIVGDVFGSNRVELASKSRINGSVYYNLIEMAIGSEVNGGLVHSPNVEEQKKLEDMSQQSLDAGLENEKA